MESRYDVKHVVDANDNDVPVGEVGEVIIKSLNKWRVTEYTRCYWGSNWGWMVFSGDMAILMMRVFSIFMTELRIWLFRKGEYLSCWGWECFTEPPQIHDAAVTIPDEKWGEATAETIVQMEGSLMKLTISYVRTQIAGYKCPKTVEHINKLPRNPLQNTRKDLWPLLEGQDRNVS